MPFYKVFQNGPPFNTDQPSVGFQHSEGAVNEAIRPGFYLDNSLCLIVYGENLSFSFNVSTRIHANSAQPVPYRIMFVLFGDETAHMQ